jgi:hypothetical protein
MVWVVSRFSLKVENSFTRSHKSINNDGIHEKDLLAAASTSAHRVPSTLIADYKFTIKKKNVMQPRYRSGMAQRVPGS